MESAENQPLPSSEPKKTRDLSRTETIKLLNDSIGRLEQTINRISEDSTRALPSSESVEALLTTTEELANSVTPPEPIPTPEPVPEPTSPKVEATTPNEVKADTKPKIPSSKSEIPKNRQPKKSSAIAIGVTAIAIAVVAIFWLWLPERNATTPSISRPLVSEPTTEIATNFDADEPTVDFPPTQDNITVEDADDSIEGADDSIASPEIIETVIPPDLESPGRVENLKIVAVEPELIFTPEQTLIAALPARISQLTKDYRELVEVIKVDLPQSRLSVEITDDWYSLDESRQDKLANKMLERSRQLDFDRLELQDSTGTLVARSPVIGDRIVILESSKNSEPSIVDD